MSQHRRALQLLIAGGVGAIMLTMPTLAEAAPLTQDNSMAGDTLYPSIDGQGAKIRIR